MIPSFLDFADAKAASENFTLDPSQIAFINYLHSLKLPQFQESMLGKLKRRFLHSDEHQGIYIHGEAGRGKSMILKWYCAALNDERASYKHFHKFMIWVHKSLNDFGHKYKDPLLHLVSTIEKNTKLLILDELQINNIADAMIVSRLFKLLFQKGVLVIISSNRIPDDLYLDGLQRERFLPFIDFIKQDYTIINIDNNIDYRLNKFEARDLYVIESHARVNAQLCEIIGENELEEAMITVCENHHITVKRTHGIVAVFDFWELCKNALGAPEYIAICEHFSILVIYDIPKFSASEHNELLRFITLIDCMYDNHTRLICSAAAEPDKLYSKGMHAFEFQRTISRLNEMKSSEYFRSE